MKRMKNIVIGIISICLLIPLWSNQVFAASGSVSVSGASGEVGSTVTVTGTIKSPTAIAGASVVVSYAPGELEYVGGSNSVVGGAGSVQYFGDAIGQNKKTLTFSMKFKIKKEGSFKVKVGHADVVTEDNEQLTMKTSGATISGRVVEKEEPKEEKPVEQKPTQQKPVEQKPKSSNTKLNSLKVYPGTLSPEFSSDTRSYTVSVPEGTTEVTISAIAQSEEATFYTSGGKDLKEDVENLAKVVVTAEDGTTNSYSLKIVVTKKERITIDATEYIVESIKKKEIPSGFEKETIMYDGKELSGLKSKARNIQLLALAKDGEEKVLYIVDSTRKTIYPFYEVNISKERSIMMMPITEDAFEGMEKVSLILNGKQVDAWQEADELYVLQVMDQEGNELKYRYDEVDKTYQRYIVAENQEENSEESVMVDERDTILPSLLEAYYDYILIGALGIIVILLVLVIAFGANTDKRRRKKLAKLKARKQKEPSPWIDL